MFYSTVIIFYMLHSIHVISNVHSRFKTKCKIHLNKYKPTLDVVEAR